VRKARLTVENETLRVLEERHLSEGLLGNPLGRLDLLEGYVDKLEVLEPELVGADEDSAGALTDRGGREGTREKEFSN
jgi:hypothetical protein